MRNGGRGADVTEREHFDFEVAGVVSDLEHVANANLARRLGLLAVGLDAAEIAGAGSEGPSFKEAGSPEEFVEAEGHGNIVQQEPAPGSGHRP